MTPIKTSNVKASYLVERKIEFQGSNTFGVWERDKGVYKVYSYGFHFPMYAWKKGRWYENVDKYSPTTSKQQSQLRPDVMFFAKLDTNKLINL